LLMLLVASIVRTSTSASEWWSRTIGRGYLTISSFLSSFLPFSLMEIYFIALAILVVILLIRLIINFSRKDVKKGVDKSLLIVALVFGTIATYTFVCGPMYQRAAVDLPTYEENVDQHEFKNIVLSYQDDFNYCASFLSFDDNGEIIMEDDLNILGQKVSLEFRKLNSDYFNSNDSRVKPMLSSFIYRELHITGVSFAITGEANINYLCDKASIPFTMAHELAHQRGVMREDDANLVALYICLGSKDPYIRYSAYMNSYWSLADLLYYTGTPSDASLINNLDNSILKNINFIHKYWEEHNIAKDIGEAINNAYLESNGTEGTSTYVDDYDVEPEEKEEKGEQGETLYNIEFTPFQKMYFHYYFN